jgi:glycine dehydrogenase
MMNTKPAKDVVNEVALLNRKIKATIGMLSDPTFDGVDELKNAPHTLQDILSESGLGYPRELAAVPDREFKGSKYWPSVARIDNVYGDRNLVCACPPMSSYEPPSQP